MLAAAIFISAFLSPFIKYLRNYIFGDQRYGMISFSHTKEFRFWSAQQKVTSVHTYDRRWPNELSLGDQKFRDSNPRFEIGKWLLAVTGLATTPDVLRPCVVLCCFKFQGHGYRSSLLSYYTDVPSMSWKILRFINPTGRSPVAGGHYSEYGWYDHFISNNLNYTHK